MGSACHRCLPAASLSLTWMPIDRNTCTTLPTSTRNSYRCRPCTSSRHRHQGARRRHLCLPKDPARPQPLQRMPCRFVLRGIPDALDPRIPSHAHPPSTTTTVLDSCVAPRHWFFYPCQDFLELTVSGPFPGARASVACSAEGCCFEAIATSSSTPSSASARRGPRRRWRSSPEL